MYVHTDTHRHTDTHTHMHASLGAVVGLALVGLGAGLEVGSGLGEIGVWRARRDEVNVEREAEDRVALRPPERRLAIEPQRVEEAARGDLRGAPAEVCALALVAEPPL